LPFPSSPHWAPITAITLATETLSGLKLSKID
jgi:hypothetical protein